MNSPFQKYNGYSGLSNKSNPLDTIPIESIIYSNFIRYDKLRELTLNQFSNSNANQLNIYIDMYTMIKSIYDRNLIHEGSLFASMILNLAAHMRSYYWTRHQVSTNIYIIMTSNSNTVSPEPAMVPEWGESIKFITDPKRSEILKWNIQLLKLLVPYFPRLHFIYGSVESSIMINNLIRQNNNRYPNIILSKDLMTWQIPSLDFNSCVFRPHKSKNEDLSFCVNRQNVFEMWRHTVNHSKTQSSVVLPPEMLSLYIALTSFKNRGLNSYYSSRTVPSMLWKLVEDRKISLGYNSPEAISKVLRSLEMKKDYLKEFESYTNNLLYRYNMVDLNRLTMIYSNSPEANDKSWDYHKIDPDSIKEINDKYFINTPIDIIKLYDNPPEA